MSWVDHVHPGTLHPWTNNSRGRRAAGAAGRHQPSNSRSRTPCSRSGSHWVAPPPAAYRATSDIASDRGGDLRPRPFNPLQASSPPGRTTAPPRLDGSLPTHCCHSTSPEADGQPSLGAARLASRKLTLVATRTRPGAVVQGRRLGGAPNWVTRPTETSRREPPCSSAVRAWDQRDFITRSCSGCPMIWVWKSALDEYTAPGVKLSGAEFVAISRRQSAPGG